MNSDQHSDDIFIGAGFGDLTAAGELVSAGLKAAVLEAFHRVGGRVLRRDSSLGWPLELGGGLIHWLQPHLWSEFVVAGLELESPESLDTARWIPSSDCQVAKTPIQDYLAKQGPAMAELTGCSALGSCQRSLSISPYPRITYGSRARTTHGVDRSH